MTNEVSMMAFGEEFDPQAMIGALASEAADEIQEARDLDEVIKVNRAGKIVIGKDDEVDPDSLRVIVDVRTYSAGWRTWIHNEDGSIADVPIVCRPMRSVPKGGVPKPAPLKTWIRDAETKQMKQVDAEWRPYREFRMLVINHDRGDIGRVLTWAQDSGWGVRFFDTLFARNHARSQEAQAGRVPPMVCPVLSLGTKYVSQAKFPFTKMIFEIQDWADRPSTEYKTASQARIAAVRASRVEAERQLAAGEAEEAEVEVVEAEEAPKKTTKTAGRRAKATPKK